MICNCLLMTIAIGIGTLTPPTILTSYNGINLIIIIITALTNPAVCPHDKFRRGGQRLSARLIPR